VADFGDSTSPKHINWTDVANVILILLAVMTLFGFERVKTFCYGVSDFVQKASLRVSHFVQAAFIGIGGLVQRVCNRVGEFKAACVQASHFVQSSMNTIGKFWNRLRASFSGDQGMFEDIPTFVSGYRDP